MPQEPDETLETEETPDTETSRITSLADLSAKVDSLIERVSSLGKGSSTRTKTDDAADVASQVKSEVQKIRAAEDRSKREDSRIGKLEEAVKKIAEKPPVEYRKVTKWLWGGDES